MDQAADSAFNPWQVAMQVFDNAADILTTGSRGAGTRQILRARADRPLPRQDARWPKTDFVISAAFLPLLLYHSPIIFHHAKPTAVQMARLTKEISNPIRHQSPCETYPAEKRIGAGTVP